LALLERLVMGGKMTKHFDVFGFAVGTVEVRMVVEAESLEDAKVKAKELFNQGQRGDIKYSCDDGACVDFEPIGADERDIY